jgi:hypothetical protein
LLRRGRVFIGFEVQIELIYLEIEASTDAQKKRPAELPVFF